MLPTLEQHTSVPQTDVGSEAILMNLLAILAFVLTVPPLFLLCIRFRRRQPANQVGAEQHGIDNPGRADDDIEIPAPNIQQEQARAETVVPIEEGENPYDEVCVGRQLGASANNVQQEQARAETVVPKEGENPYEEVSFGRQLEESANNVQQEQARAETIVPMPGVENVYDKVCVGRQLGVTAMKKDQGKDQGPEFNETAYKMFTIGAQLPHNMRGSTTPRPISVGKIESTSFTTDGNCKDEDFKESKANVTVSKRTSFDKDTLQCVIKNGGLNRRLHEIEPDMKDERIGETLSNRTLTSYPVYENIGEVFDSTRAFQFEAGKCSAEETCSTTRTDTNPVYQNVNYFMNEQQEQEVMTPEQIVTSCSEACAEHYTMSDVNLSDQDSLSSDVDIYTDDTSGYGLSASTDPPALTPEECSKTATYHESCSSFTEAHQPFPGEGELKYWSSGNFDNQGIQSCYLKGRTPGANVSDQGSFSSGVHMNTDDTVSRGSSSDQALYLPSSRMFSNTATNPETCPGCTFHDRNPHEVHQLFTEGGDLANGSGGNIVTQNIPSCSLKDHTPSCPWASVSDTDSWSSDRDMYTDDTLSCSASTDLPALSPEVFSSNAYPEFGSSSTLQDTDSFDMFQSCKLFTEEGDQAGGSCGNIVTQDMEPVDSPIDLPSPSLHGSDPHEVHQPLTEESGHTDGPCGNIDTQRMVSCDSPVDLPSPFLPPQVRSNTDYSVQLSANFVPHIANPDELQQISVEVKGESTVELQPQLPRETEAVDESTTNSKQQKMTENVSIETDKLLRVFLQSQHDISISDMLQSDEPSSVQSEPDKYEDGLTGFGEGFSKEERQRISFDLKIGLGDSSCETQTSDNMVEEIDSPMSTYSELNIANDGNVVTHESSVTEQIEPEQQQAIDSFPRRIINMLSYGLGFFHRK